MDFDRLITENQLHEWVCSNAREAQGVIPELILRLVAASVPNPVERRFPLGDSIEQPGPDGELKIRGGYDPFVPDGRSFWEIGTGADARVKATTDYKELTETTPTTDRIESTFVFVTPLSGRRGWAHTWKQDGQARWLKERRQHQEWRDVRIIDGSRLVDWLIRFPAVARWLAGKMGLPVHQMETPEQRWLLLTAMGDPPLTPALFLANRAEACDNVRKILTGVNDRRLRLDTRYPRQVADFVTACIADMDKQAGLDALGRCLILSDSVAWKVVADSAEPHVLIADFDLDDEVDGAKLLETARIAGHAVIYAGLPGGIPKSDRVTLPDPTSHQIQEALEAAGYERERARMLAHRSDGNLTSLLRCLNNLPLAPSWALSPNATDLALAELLGSWSARSEADRATVEQVTGRAYDEWIINMQWIALDPDPPLSQHNGQWKFVARYEGWDALGRRLFDDHLDRIRAAAICVLRERDPQFELPPEQRHMASVHNKDLKHSNLLRRGVAQTLALLGSHPDALTSCSAGKAEGTAILAVREILADADWVLWASLNDLLPLLAEASPRDFLDAVDAALNCDPSPIDALFDQEGDGITGRNYMTGMFWALETLAWNKEYLVRAMVLLGELAARDPGGKWANRPANSLAMTLLPWLPQTCAPVGTRRVAVETLLDEVPAVAWQLMLALLPRPYGASHGTYKPAWREWLTDNCGGRATNEEYWQQVTGYANLAIQVAQGDIDKLVDLISNLQSLTRAAQDQLLAYLRSDAVLALPEADRSRLWTALLGFVSKHRLVADAEWAIAPEMVDEVARIADRIAPASPRYRHHRLFSERDYDLLSERGSYDKQQKELEARRQKAVGEIYAAGGLTEMLEFARAVETPWRVGGAFGTVAPDQADCEILPTYLGAEQDAVKQFTGGFVIGRFRICGWPWVDRLCLAQWTHSQQGQLLAYLPFVPETWERVTRLMGSDQSEYWSRTHATPHDTQHGLEYAIDCLIANGRAWAAIRCIEKLKHDGTHVSSERTIKALRAALQASDSAHPNDSFDIVEIIKMLQDDPETNPDDLMQIEWAFLRLLDRFHGASPKMLERGLANDPAFFCEVIQSVFKSRKPEAPVEEPTEQQTAIAQNAYRLLSDWRIPPGSRPDGTYDGEALNAWLKAVKSACAGSGHLEIALRMVGHVLTYVPPDPDGLWIHHAAAKALNAREAGKMRTGFQSQLFNSRGVYSPTGGREERELAEIYRARAAELEAQRYHRLADTLRELAASYDYHAKAEEVEATLND